MLDPTTPVPTTKSASAAPGDGSAAPASGTGAAPSPSTRAEGPENGASGFLALLALASGQLPLPSTTKGAAVREPPAHAADSQAQAAAQLRLAEGAAEATPGIAGKGGNGLPPDGGKILPPVTGEWAPSSAPLTSTAMAVSSMPQRIITGPAEAGPVASTSAPAAMPGGFADGVEGMPVLVPHGASEPDQNPAAGERLAGKAAVELIAGQAMARGEPQPQTARGMTAHAGAEVRGHGPMQTPTTPTPLAQPPLGQPLAPAEPGFHEALGQRLIAMAQRGTRDARVQVHPEHLGRIDIQVKVEGDNAQVSFSASHAGVRDALEQSLPRLREMLGDAGLNLSQADVSDQQAQTSHEDSGGGEANPRQPEADSRATGPHADDPEPARPLMSHRILDTFA